MKFHEKLSFLTEGMNKSAIGSSAGVGPTGISNYIAKKSIPRADIALKIARALKVPLETLVDDSAEWPPPSTAPLAAPSPAALANFGPALNVSRPHRMNASQVAGVLGELTAFMLHSFMLENAAANLAAPSSGDGDEALIEATISNLRASNSAARRHACMALPSPIFEELCRRLLTRNSTVKAVAEWLDTKVKNGPTRSSVERFSDLLFKQFQSFVRDRARVKG